MLLGLLAGVGIGLRLGAATASAAESTPTSPSVLRPAPGPATPLASEHLQNLFRVTPRLFSGSAPESAAAFEELKSLGVTTVISVDGARPEVAAARAAGLRYLHLPFGYDGIPSNRVAELIRAVRTAPGPIYVHCHHGKHRGPAAVAVICSGTEGWDASRAEQWLVQAGTSREYPGLYRAATQPAPPPAASLAAGTELPEVNRVSTEVEAMVALDARSDHLKAFQKANWRPLASAPDLTPSQEATLLWEQLRELGRLEALTNRPAAYRVLLREAEQAAAELKSALQTPISPSGAADAALQAVQRSCASCHRAHRN